jgi:hypothetical protein
MDPLTKKETYACMRTTKIQNKNSKQKQNDHSYMRQRHGNRPGKL